MRDRTPGGVQTNPTTFWSRDIAQIPTHYGRLVYLSSLRNSDTGRYEHYAVRSDAEATEANRILKRAHEEIFREWMSYPLEWKKADVELYVEAIQVDKIELLDTWQRLTPYGNVVPASIGGPERAKHVSDFEAILGLLKNVYGVASPDA